MSERPNLLFSEGEILDIYMKAGREAFTPTDIRNRGLRTSILFTRFINEELVRKLKTQAIFDSKRNLK